MPWPAILSAMLDDVRDGAALDVEKRLLMNKVVGHFPGAGQGKIAKFLLCGQSSRLESSLMRSKIH